jgi:ribonucleoside-diphosphate reductase alpha chain
MEKTRKRTTAKSKKAMKGLTIPRYYTQTGVDPFASTAWTTRTSRITNPDGSVVFEMKDAEIPAGWSQVAADIMVSKYFRKAGVPQYAADGSIIRDENGEPVLGPERSARQVFNRLAGCWRWWGETHGYFATEADAQAFYDELVYMLIHQMAAPNSPQWFNTGINYAYGITGPAQGHFYTDPITGEVKQSEDAYTHPQPHACQPWEARVSTPNGPMPIGEIVDRNLVGLRVYDGTANGMGTTRVVAVKANGEKPVWRIVLKNGQAIEATPDHLVQVRTKRRALVEWKRVDEVNPGDRLLHSTVTRVTDFSTDTGTDEAALAGWLQGDGFVGQYDQGTNRSLTLEFITINDDEFQHVMERVERVFPRHHIKVRAVESKDQTLDIRRIRLYGEELRPFVEKFDLLRGNDELKVPAAIERAGAQAQRAYLQSLFQADGTVRLRQRSTRTSDVVLTTVSQPLAAGVQTLLANHGIYSRISRGSDKRENRRTPYQVSIGYATARNRYAETIGFVSSDKKAKLDIACSTEFPGKELPALREEVVDRIEMTGVRPVYDIQTESGQYLSNNVIVHNCFIQSIDDDLVGEGGIMDLWVREARLFKYGSGTGTNFSNLRGEGEPLSGGGSSSGLMSFLRVGDRAAGAIKSGGTTRRAAKMVCLDVDHPDIEAFINWKASEEKKVQALIDAGYSADFNGEAYATVSGQNANNSVRISNDFLDAVRNDSDWNLTRRTDGSVHKTVRARDIWNQVAEAAWKSADPGVQYDTTINEWHTCPESGRINASNPCSEYMFLDNTACNLASLNMMKFVDDETGAVDIEGYLHATRLWTVVLEISVLMAQFPSKEIARLSYDFRTLGLGYANIGTAIMLRGLAYDSDEARAFTSAMTAIMTGESYATSAEMARLLGPFREYDKNAPHMLRVIRNHRRAAYNVPVEEYENLTVAPMGLDADLAPGELVAAAKDAWDRALELGEQYGYRNAQTTLLAPTGTIGLLMDCDTTGVEPDFALVKFKKLAGGGYFKIANQSIEPALRNLGYSEHERKAILDYVLGTLTLDGAPHVNRESLKEKGFTDADIDKVNAALPSVFELGFAFNVWSLGDETMARIGISKEESSKPGFDLLRHIGFTQTEIEAANEHICGTMTVEGAPYLKEEDLPVFDTANKCGKKGTRFIHYMGHVKMMAAAQSFLSGAISKTINMPNEATVEDILDAYEQSWHQSLKAMAIYRDGSKLSQPLSAKSSSGSAASAVSEAEIQQRIDDAVAIAVAEALARAEEEKQQEVAAAVAEAIGHPEPYRRRLPARRTGFTQESRVAGHKVFLRTGEYEDGRLGEIFIDMHKEGAAFRSMINCFAIAVSKGLQYGVPLDEFVETFTFTRFEPQGMVSGHPNIKMATSIIDYVFRVVGLEYLGRTDLAQVPPDLNESDEDDYGTDSDDAPFQAVIAESSEPAPSTSPEPVVAVASPPVAEPVAVKTNGNGKNGHSSYGDLEVSYQYESNVATLSMSGALDAQLSEMMGDAPFCDNCGHITVRNGSCYRCLNCGNSLGCS